MNPADILDGPEALVQQQLAATAPAPKPVPTLTHATLCGRNVGGGVSPAFAAVLAKIDAALRAQHATEAPTTDYAAWCGVANVGGYRPAPSGWHGKGVAVDLNYSTNGYAATRTVLDLGMVHYGGEAAGLAFSQRRPAMEACDRACMALDGKPADLSARKLHESTGAAWDRWHRVSEAVRAYFAPYYDPTQELDVGATPARPGVTIPERVAEDYDAIRLPLVVGAPSLHPRTTRNPARGLMDLPRHVVVAMCDVGGCRWGAVDFGAAESGDVMHFDRPALA